MLPMCSTQLQHPPGDQHIPPLNEYQTLLVHSLSSDARMAFKQMSPEEKNTTLYWLSKLKGDRLLAEKFSLSDVQLSQIRDGLRQDEVTLPRGRKLGLSPASQSRPATASLCDH